MKNLPGAISAVCTAIVCGLLAAIFILPYSFTDSIAMALIFLGFPAAVVALLSGLVGLVVGVRGGRGGLLPSSLGCAVGLFCVLLAWFIALGPPD